MNQGGKAPAKNDIAGSDWVALDRAAFEFRRGRPVIVHHPAGAAVILPAELLYASTFASLRQFGKGRPWVAVTRERAQTRGLPVLPDQSVAVYEGDDMSLNGLLALADPLLDTDLDQTKVKLAHQADIILAVAAIALAKHAELLPAVLMVPLTTAELADSRSAHVVKANADWLASPAAQRHVQWEKVADARVPLVDAGNSKILAYRPVGGGQQHLAVVIGNPDVRQPVLIRLHSECFTGDLLGSLRCDCGDQLRGAIRAIQQAGGGVLLYLAQEGRGIGLVNKLRAYTLQDTGLDTLDANLHLGFGADERIYAPATAILHELGVTRVRLLTNNPEKVAALQAAGVEVVERVSHSFEANEHNERYLQTKADRSGHLF